MGAIELTALLWREREAMRAVLERQQELVEALQTGDRGRIDHAISVLRDVLDRLRPVILMRDIEVAAVAGEWGLGPEPTVAALPRFAPPGPWGDIFADHLAALRDLARRSLALSRESERLLASHDISLELRVPVRPDAYEEPPAG